MTEGEATTTYTYDLNNRLLESNEVAGDAEVNTKYFYDANGNQTTKAVMASAVYDGAGAGHTVSGDTNEYIAIYDYNCYNQLTGVDTNGVVSSYAYLPDGMRLSKTVGDNTTTFVYDGANIVEEITAEGVNKYYRGIEIVKNGDGIYYLYNGQGDVAMLTDSTGNTVASYIFDAYGNTDSENTVYNNFGYRGEYSDAESGLIYLRARMYDPSTGRFINEDPIRDGLNWYVYCDGNPVMFVDPNGTDAIVILNKNGAQSSEKNGGDGIAMGHMAIIVQNENGEWYYFSCGKGYVTFRPVESKYMSDIKTFSEEFYWEGMYYTDATYIKGDFQDSYAFFENYNKENSLNRNASYNLLSNNCSTVVMKGLKKGKLKDGTKISDFIDTSIAGTPNMKMLSLQSVFYNSEFTAESSHKVINDMLWEMKNGPWWKRSKRIADKLEKLH